LLYKYLNNFYSVYLDNILIYLKNNIKEYCIYIKKLLVKFSKVSLYLDIRKYKFKYKKIKYFNFII
ncbi:hypothetical protein BO71DRAFT_313180, partial [Aspergillus ellipticus CBS 707.79]